MSVPDTPWWGEGERNREREGKGERKIAAPRDSCGLFWWDVTHNMLNSKHAVSKTESMRTERASERERESVRVDMFLEAWGLQEQSSKRSYRSVSDWGLETFLAKVCIFGQALRDLSNSFNNKSPCHEAALGSCCCWLAELTAVMFRVYAAS